MASKSVKEQPPNSRRAVIDCFLRNASNEDGLLFAVVNRHVTRTAGKSFFQDINHKTEIATKINFKRSEADSMINDVDLIEIPVSKRHFVEPIYRKISGEKRRNFRLYEGSVADLNGVEVFQSYRPNGTQNIICKQGKIVPLPPICPVSNFGVAGVEDEPFTVVGDSGRVVARVAGDGEIELVGIITWDQFKSQTDKSQSGNYTICMLLKSAIEYLKPLYGKTLCLYTTPGPTGEWNAEEIIESGQIVYF